MHALVPRANVCVVQGANVDVALASRVTRSPVVVASAILFVVEPRLAHAHAVHRVAVHHHVAVAGVVVVVAITSKFDSRSFFNLDRRPHSAWSLQFVHPMIRSIENLLLLVCHILICEFGGTWTDCVCPSFAE
jgi:hypothetical protein